MQPPPSLRRQPYLLTLLLAGFVTGCTYGPAEAVDQDTASAGESVAAISPQPSAADGTNRLVAARQLTSDPKPRAERPDPATPPSGHDPLDWTYWRGPNYDSTSPETGLPDDFDPRGGEGSNVLWKREDLGGRSTPVVMNGCLYTLVRSEPGTATEGEKVVCVDLESGETLWENRFNVWLSDVPDTRVGWSSVVADPQTNQVYALGVSGYFQCIDAKTGETVWDHPLHEQFGLLSTYGGRTNFPIICDDLVIVSGVIIGWGDMARPAHRFLAFDKMTGEVVWVNGTRPLPYDTTYSAPVLAVLNGQKALVFGSGDGSVWAFQPRTGQPIWHCELSRRGLNVSPLVVNETVYMGHSEENVEGTAMGAVIAIDGTGQGDVSGTKHVLWRALGLMMGRSSPLYVDGRLYCFDDRAKLHVLDASSGETIATKNLGTMMRGTPLYADGKFYVFTANGRWYILKPDPDRGVEIVNRGRMPSGEDVMGSPICSHHKVFVQSSGGLYCFEDPSKEPGVQPTPDPPQEAPLEQDQQPALVQLVPAEVLMEPGEVQDFRVRLFNKRGQFLQDAEEASFAVEGPGQVSPNGSYLAANETSHEAAVVSAEVGQLQGQARLRIIPPLPWKFDFTGLGEPPVTWVGARYRHVIRNLDGNDVMVKITTIPKGTRSRCWFGPPHLHDYTITADVQGQLRQEKLPDIGLTAQGYAMDLQGENQALQIRSWVPHDRRAQTTIAFPWEGDTWYTMKLQASVQDGKAVLRGKVWPREDQEPAQWDIELVDDAANTSGSPGLYGNAKDAEIFLDNIRVESNGGAG